ncbi:M28 family metallopeptidase [Ascidiimonas sp. W6]|uniref:M28 family metallopeptidase n=1 Tax=Ascidiimonas meishanensis TaxID=3128903 RepID=UPI0030ED37C9
MKRILLITAGILLSCNTTQQTANNESLKKADYNPSPYASTISQEDLKEMLYVYASDSFQGRETGTPGQKKAVNYIKSRYEALGIPAAQDDGNYFQKVPLQGSSIPQASLIINDKEYTIGEDFVAYSGPNDVTINDSKIIYAGYGIEDEKYSDYKNLDVKNKILLIKAGEPKNADGTYVISGSTENTPKWSNIRKAFESKIELAKDKGASGILFYDKDNYKMLLTQYDYMKNRNSGRMGLNNSKGDSFFYFFINGKIATSINGSISSKSESKVINTKVSAVFEGSVNPIDSENVVAWIKGSEKPNEYIVISAHLDHEGVKNEEIYNGADDDGSGTVAILEIAQAFQKAVKEGNGPKRSIVFLHVTAEEKGLLGSAYYTDNPIFPLENTVADLNIDMIGRIDPKREGDRNYVYLIGSDKLSTELHNLSEQINDKYTKITLDYRYNDENDPNRFYYRSDHYNFAKNNVPVIFYFNGTHNDYHRPSDTPDKIEYDLLANRTKLVFHTAWELATIENRIVADKVIEAK